MSHQFFFCGILVALGLHASAAPLFEVTILPFNEPNDLNDAGQIVGTQQFDPDLFIWENGTVTTIPADGAYPLHTSFQELMFPYLSADGSLAAILEGYTADNTKQVLAVTFTGNLAHDLGSLPNSGTVIASPFSAVTGINDAGVVSGYSYDSTATGRAVFYSDGSVTPIGTEVGGSSDVNEAGQIVGSEGGVGFLATGGSTVPLIPLPGDTRSGVSAINENGVALGTSRGDAGESIVIWNQGGPPTDIPYPGAQYLRATDINDSLAILGKVYPESTRAWEPYYYDGNFHSLQSLVDPSDPDAVGLVIDDGVEINNNGWIIARGTNESGKVGLLLKPVTGPPPVLALRILSFGITANPGGAPASVALAVPSQTGFEYQLEILTGPELSPTPIGNPVPGTGSSLELTDPSPSAPSALYRVVKRQTGP